MALKTIFIEINQKYSKNAYRKQSKEEAIIYTVVNIFVVVYIQRSDIIFNIVNKENYQKVKKYIYKQTKEKEK